MKFSQAIASGFKNYVNFQDRASRHEFWYWVLFTYGVNFLAGLIEGITKDIVGSDFLLAFFEIVFGVFSLALILPSLSFCVRRLHDTGRTGWWYLIAFTIIGIIPLVIWWSAPGKPGINPFGPNPLEDPLADVF